MFPTLKGDFFDSGFLLSAVVAWILSALVLLTAAAILLHELGCGAGSLGYASSAVSFLSAVCAGAAAAHRRRTGNLYTAAISAAVIVTALLTVGFLIDGVEIDASAVMSVVSFTFAGCMVGAVLLYRPERRGKRYVPRP